MSDISKRLTKYRKTAKLSQEEVAEKLNVSRQTVSKWETGQSTPDFDKIAPLCELYNISTDELLRGVVTPKKEEPTENEEIEEDDDDNDEDEDDEYCKKCAKRKSPNAVIISGVFTILSIFTLIIYLLVSFSTGAWHITWIIWLIYAIIITILKIIFAVFGVYIDDDLKAEESKKPSRGLRVFGLIMALFCLLLVTGFVGAFFIMPGGMFFGINKGVSDHKNFEDAYDIDFKNLSINAKAGEVLVKNSEVEKMHVVIFSDENKEYEIKKSNDTFRIDVENDGCRGISCFNYKMPKIEVYLPENYAEKIEINNNYGNINVGDFKDATMKIDEDFGEAKVGAVKNLELENNMGATKINKILGSAKIKNSMGSIEIEELDLTENSSIENSMGSIKIKKTNDIYIDAKADMGSANISKNNRESKIELRVRCSMGSINID